MGEEFRKALANTLIRQEKRIAMLEMTLSNLLRYLEEKGVLSEGEIDDLFDASERLTEMEIRERVDLVKEAFGLTASPQ